MADRIARYAGHDHRYGAAVLCGLAASPRDQRATFAVRHSAARTSEHSRPHRPRAVDRSAVRRAIVARSPEMSKLSRPRSAVDRKGRRNYIILCAASAVGITAFVAGASISLYAS
jgi:hypothetical protein